MESIPYPGLFKQETSPGPLATVSFQAFIISQVAQVVDFKARPQNVHSRLFFSWLLPALLFLIPEKLWLEPDANRPKSLLPGPSQHPSQETRGFPGPEGPPLGRGPEPSKALLL